MTLSKIYISSLLIITVSSVLSFLVEFVDGVIDNRRPIYSIGHMVNSIKEVREFLHLGANVLESDITFNEDGTVNKIYHGFPCDCLRYCEHSANLEDYLDHVREVTDPKTPNNYHDQMIMQFFDMKLDNVKDLEKAGSEMADAVLDHLWLNITGSERIRVLLFIYNPNQNGTLKGFSDRFKKRGVEDLLKFVGFDGGTRNVKATGEMFKKLGITKGIWLGDGITNCLSFIYPVHRLLEELRIRDSSDGYINKVYHWTIDIPLKIKKDLDRNVDGLITNFPNFVRSILSKEPYASKMRLATPSDDPFTKFVPSTTEDS